MSSAGVPYLEHVKRNWAEFASWNSALFLRFALAALGVLLCYCFHWQWLRFLTSEANLRLDGWLGLHFQRLSGDTVVWNGIRYTYENACTFADVWCGAIPLIWNFRKGVAWNLSLIAVFSILLFAFNIFRLSLSDYIFNAGIPWTWAHGFLGGIAYFAVWAWIFKNRSW
jgi:hypothetical protein